jgi:menaquinone-9 beta-reductase
MKYNYDIIIIGAGPGGSTTAIYAAKHNLKVLLIDKAIFPRDKVCGDVIPGDCFPILEELNLLDQLNQSPHGEGTTVYYAEPQDLRFPRLNNNDHVIVCRRYIFDNILFQTAKNYGDTQEGFKLQNLLIESGQVYGIKGISAEGKSCQYTAKIIVGADGCSSTVARKLGLEQKDIFHEAFATRTYYRNLSLEPEKLEFYYLPDCIPGYFWIFPVDQGIFNTGIVIFSEGQKKSAQKIYQELENSLLLKEKFQSAEVIDRIKGWYLPIGSKQRVIHGNGFILVGDAAGLIDPLLAHGIDSAMISGKIGAEVLAKVCSGDDYTESALKIYADQIWLRFSKIYHHRYNFRQKWFTSSDYRDRLLQALKSRGL